MPEKEKNIYVGTGISKSDDSYLAGQEAVDMAIKKCGQPPEFGIVFCSGKKYGKDDRTIKALVRGAHDAFMKANPKCRWIGCTTAGEISNYGHTTGSCVAMALKSPFIHVGTASEKYNKRDPASTGRSVAKKSFSDLKIDRHLDSYVDYLRSKNMNATDAVKMNPYKLIILGKGVEQKFGPIPELFNNEFVIKGAEDELSGHISICGGAAADDWVLKKNYTFENGNLHKDRIVAAAMFINLFHDTGLSHGYKPTDKMLVVTKVAGDDWITEANNRPVLEAYSEMIGQSPDIVKKDSIEASMKHPLASFDMMGDYWIKTIGKYLRGGFYTGSVIKPLTPLQIMEVDEKSVLHSLKDAIMNNYSRAEGNIAFSIIFDCAIRLRILGNKANEEVALLKKELKNTPFIGFYTYGEFGCPHPGKVLFHNQTVSILRVHDKILV